VTVLEAATDLLASRWRTGVTVREVLVDHQDRAVIRTVDPLARPVSSRPTGIPRGCGARPKL